jgi:hypothetical protein
MPVFVHLSRKNDTSIILIKNGNSAFIIKFYTYKNIKTKSQYLCK